MRITHGNVIITQRVRAAMAEYGITQAQLGALLQIEQPSVSRRLNGRTPWTVADVELLAAWLRLPVTEFLAGEIPVQRDHAASA